MASDSSDRGTTLRRPETFEILPQLRAAGRGGHLVPEGGQQQHREGTDPTGGPGYQHLPLSRRHAVGLQRLEGDGRGEAGGPEAHRRSCRHARRQFNRPCRPQPRPLGVPSPEQLADAVPRRDHGVPGREAGVGAGGHRAGQVDAGHVRVLLDQAAEPVENEAVLVVEGGVFDRYLDLPFRQLVFSDFFDRRGGLAVFPAQQECFHGSRFRFAAAAGNSREGGRARWNGREVRDMAVSRSGSCFRPP